VLWLLTRKRGLQTVKTLSSSLLLLLKLGLIELYLKVLLYLDLPFHQSGRVSCLVSLAFLCLKCRPTTKPKDQSCQCRREANPLLESRLLHPLPCLLQPCQLISRLQPCQLISRLDCHPFLPTNYLLLNPSLLHPQPFDLVHHHLHRIIISASNTIHHLKRNSSLIP
jgi:hypothetical protein